MTDRLIPIKRVDDIPDFATEAEAAEFYDTHDLASLPPTRFQALTFRINVLL